MPETTKPYPRSFYQVILPHLPSAVFLILALLGIYLTSFHNYLLFHSLAEGFAIIIAGGIFMIAWNARKLLPNHYLLMVGIAYLNVGAIDFVHMMSYKGMGVFENEGANIPTQLWIAARYLEALSLLSAPFFFKRRTSPRGAFVAYALVTALFLASIFYWKIFPDCFIEGSGLTPFKIFSEYLICLILVAAGVILMRKAKDLHRNILILILASIAVTIVQELSFTLYIDLYGLSNMIGHFLKVVSFYLLYKAIIHTGLIAPWDLLFTELKHSEQRYRGLFETMNEGFALHEIIKDNQGNPYDYRFLEINPAFEGQTGLKAADISGRTLHEVLPQVEATWVERYGRVALTGEPAHFEEWSEALGRHYQVSAFQTAPEQFAAIFLDITDKKRAREELQRKESRFRLLSKTAGSLLQTNDPQGIVNDLCREVMEHLDCHVFFNFLADEGAGKLHLNAWAGIPEEEALKIEWLDYGIAVCGCTAQSMRPIIAEDIFHTPDIRTDLVKSYGIQAYACHPLLAQGQIIGTLSFGTKTRKYFSEEDLDLMRTVTDQVATAMERIRLILEIRKARGELETRVQERTSELARINRDLTDFNHIATHDLQEPLRLIMTLGDLLISKYRENMDKEGQYIIERIQNSTKRAVTSIRDIQKYSMLSSHQPRFRQTDLNMVLSGVMAEFKELGTKSGAVVEVGDLPTLEADAEQIGDVFRNLLSNALKFNGSARPRIQISAGAVDAGTRYRIYVKDNGIGFNERFLDKIFTPFQRLNDMLRFEGSGIGLALCRKLVEAHGGSITATSKPDQGATFIITLPVHQQKNI